MIKIMKEMWDKNRDKLKEELMSLDNIEYLNYKDIVKITFDKIYNAENLSWHKFLNLNNIHEINDGDYQGTLIYLIPFDTYQPDEKDYLMTFIWYGSCSVCDTLQSIQSLDSKEQQVEDLMTLCKDIVCNTIKPYNYGWRHYEKFDIVEEIK